MKKRGISIAAILIACVFVGTIAVTAVCIYNDYSAGLTSATARFEKLSSRTAETSEYFPSGSKEFISTFNAAVGSPDIYQQLTLKIDGLEVYSYPAESTQVHSVFVKTFNTRISGGDGAKIELAADIYTLSPGLIFYRAKIAFIVILAGTFIACILLMYLYLSESGTEEKTVETSIEEDPIFEDENPVFSNDESTEDDRSAYDEPTTYDDLVIDTTSAEEAPAQEEDFTEPAVPEDPPIDYSAMEDAFEEQKNSFAEEAPSEKTETPQPEEPVSKSAAVEQGLFSPISGFGWESYLDTRLESELIRSASSEQDLALILIKVPGIDSNSPCYKNLCKTLLDFFQYKDFIFEYKKDGFAAIIQNKGIDSAMESAELLYTEFASVLNAAGVNSKPLMGISSRSLRLISAERLKVEADQALLHAADDADSPIVAFRVNPEKYRKYINAQQQ